MDYMREINAFERWLETNYLPCLSQLLWYRLMALCNRAGWPEWVIVDNCRLMGMIQSKREATAIAARDSLIDSGFIEFEKGKKGKPNRYKLLTCTFKNVVKSEVYSVVNTVVQSEVQSVAQTADISSYPTDTQYTKTKTKTNTERAFARKGARHAPDALKLGTLQNVLLTAEELERLRADYADADAVIDWLSLYIADKGYKFKGQTHNLSIRRWVVTAYREHKAREDRASAKDKPAALPKPVNAQMYTQREYTREQLDDLFERI